MAEVSDEERAAQVGASFLAGAIMGGVAAIGGIAKLISHIAKAADES